LQTVKQFFESIGDNRELYEIIEQLPISEQYVRVEEMTYRQVVDIREGIEHMISDYELALLIGRVLLKADVSEMNYTDYLPYMLSVLKWNEKLIMNEVKCLKYVPTSDEKAAGIDKLGKFKDFAVVDTIVKSRPCYTHDEVYDLPYTTVFSMQYYDSEVAKFERKLIKIQQKTGQLTTS
jgi:hypothetical protein